MAGGREGGHWAAHSAPHSFPCMHYELCSQNRHTRIGDKMRSHHSIDVCSAGSRGGVEDLHIFMLHEQLTLVGKCWRTQVIRVNILILYVKVHENSDS